MILSYGKIWHGIGADLESAAERQWSAHDSRREGHCRLTPFRAQRTLIKNLLKKGGLKNIVVSTVHRAQGSERHTIIFDPVDGSTPFLQTDEAEKLLNVALRRAEARLVVILSDAEDKANAILKQIMDLLEMKRGTPGKAIAYEEAVLDEMFPGKYIGKLIQFPGCLGVLQGIVKDRNGTKIIGKDSNSGAEKKFRLDLLQKKAEKLKQANGADRSNDQNEQEFPEEEFVLAFLRMKKDRGARRVHTVHSDFNRQFRERFPGEKPQVWTRKLSDDGKIITERIKGKPREYEWLALTGG
jgi:hypothetical protein